MADDFNPYREWLGLKSPAAPNYYELLSLPQFTAEISEIGPAAARATTRVRSFRPGSNAAAWSRLLDEIQAARQCLTDPARRAEYDEALRRASEQPAAHEPPAEAPAAPSALAAMAPDFYPPGMGPARPQPAPATIADNITPASTSPARPRSELDPPAPQTELAEPMYVGAEAETGASDLTESPASEEVTPATADVVETIAFESPLPLSALPDAVAYAAMPIENVGAAPSEYSGVSVPAYDPAPAYNGAGYAPVAAYPPATAWQPEATGYAAVPEAYAVPTAAAIPGTPLAPAGMESPGRFPAAEVPLSAGESASAVAARRGARRGSNVGLVAAACLGLLATAAAGMILGPQLVGNRAVTVAENKGKPPAAPPAVNKETQPTIAVAPAITKAPEPPLSAPVTVTPPVDPPAPPTTPGLPATSTPITVPDPPAPAPSPAPAATPPPTPAPAPEPAKVAREDVQALVKSLESARKYFGEQKFNAADVQLVKAESMAKLPEHKQAVARLQEAGGYARQFREAVAAAIGGMQAGETFKVGSSTQVSFVEALPDKVIFRISGMNRTYALEDLPPGLAVVVADMKLPEANPKSKIVKGAYLALHQRGDSQTIDKARSLWEEAKAAGANVDNLLPLLDDDYAEWLKDSP